MADAKRCEKCGRRRDDVKPDPALNAWLCNECWFTTNPAHPFRPDGDAKGAGR